MITEYKKPRFNLSKFLIILLIVFLVWVFGSIFSSGGSHGEAHIFVIEQGESVNSISERLQKIGYIKSSFIFKLYLQLIDNGTSIKAGEHFLSSGMGIKKIIAELNSTVAEQDLQITIIEGWDNLEIAEYLTKNINIPVNDFMAAVNREYPSYDFLPNTTVGNYLQGYLFPDTYRIMPKAEASDVVVKLLDTFTKKVYSPLQGAIAKHDLSLHEIVTLASIVEMEVSDESDRKLVAGIFLQRLVDNYPLQSDATVNYVTKSGRAQSTITDTKIDSVYNTYKYAGLPPGPICNPSLSAIEAVVYPLNNTYYFFLTTKDDGRVIYSHTYEEHLQNKAKYLD